MRQKKVLKTMMMLFGMASLGLFASCTKTDSGNGSGNGSNTSLIVGKWVCTYYHYTVTEWYDGTQISYYEHDIGTGSIIEFHSDGTTNDCMYSINGNNLIMCSFEYTIDKLTSTELQLTQVISETESSSDGHTSVLKQVYKSRYSKM